MYLHSINCIDVSDKNLISYHKESKQFVVFASDMQANEIQTYNNLVFNKESIWVWSSKYSEYLLFRQFKTKFDSEGDKIADIFCLEVNMNKKFFTQNTPDFYNNIELHIIND